MSELASTHRIDTHGDSRTNVAAGTENTAGVCRPNLLVIGAQKSATTWLRDALHQHPDVFMAEGEPQFFNRDSATLEKYFERFSGGRNCQIIGEKTPDYLHMSTRRIRRTKDILGPTKLIAVLRRPEDRAWSQARMEESSFNRGKLDAKAHARLARNVISLRNRDRTHYASHLARWIKVFGEDSLMVCFYEDVVDDSEGLLNRIFAWLGVDSSIDVTVPPPVWASQVAEIPDDVLRYLSQTYRDQSKQLMAMGLCPPDTWRDPYIAYSRGLPLLRYRAQMLAPNLLYRVFDSLRGRFSGSYTTLANRLFHRYLSSEQRTGVQVPSVR